jgi:hypothetical protein
MDRVRKSNIRTVAGGSMAVSPGDTVKPATALRQPRNCQVPARPTDHAINFLAAIIKRRTRQYPKLYAATQLHGNPMNKLIPLALAAVFALPSAAEATWYMPLQNCLTMEDIALKAGGREGDPSRPIPHTPEDWVALLNSMNMLARDPARLSDITAYFPSLDPRDVRVLHDSHPNATNNIVWVSNLSSCWIWNTRLTLNGWDVGARK